MLLAPLNIFRGIMILIRNEEELDTAIREMNELWKLRPRPIRFYELYEAIDWYNRNNVDEGIKSNE